MKHRGSSGFKHALVIDTHAAGEQQAALEALRALGDSRQATLLHTWSTEFGPLNRIVSVWDGEGMLVPEEAERPLDWLDDRRLSRALQPRHLADHRLLAAPLLEMRMYAAHPGKCEFFVEALLEVLPFRERYSPCAGIWTTRERGRDVAIHMWSYESLEMRMQARARAAVDPDWSRYRTSVRPLLHSMQAMLLIPQRGVA